MFIWGEQREPLPAIRPVSVCMVWLVVSCLVLLHSERRTSQFTNHKISRHNKQPPPHPPTFSPHNQPQQR